MIASDSRVGAWTAERALPLTGLLLAAATVTIGVSIEAFGGRLGAPSPPFLMRWAPSADPFAAGSVLVLAAATAATPRWIAGVRRPAAIAAGL